MKPCPFCGSANIKEFVYPYMKPGLRGCFVFCAKCGAQTGKHESIEKARTVWNHRTNEREEQKK